MTEAALLRSNDPCWCGSGRKYKRCHKVGEGLSAIRPGTVSPMRSVPDNIPRPRWADTGRVERKVEALVKSPDVLDRMRRAGRAAGEILAAAGAAVIPGITTDELDAHDHEACIERGGYPSPLNYHGYPKSLCTSVNEVVCHGIPDDRQLRDGDIVNLDVTIYLNGVHGDTNATFLVGTVDDASRRLVRVTRECLWRGIEAVKPGARLCEVGRAIEEHATAHGYGVVRDFVGHGIGEEFHTTPTVHHFYEPANNLVLEPGMTFTIEPMITMGTWRVKLWDDGWTAVTADGLRTAQFEHTVVVTEAGVDVLTDVG